MKLYHSGLVRVASNTRYPFQVDVQNVEQLLQVIKFDHVAALYRDSKRSEKNFISSDCIMMDVDNAPGKGQPDIPSSEWVDLDRIRRDLPSVAFYAVTSRNHLKAKDGRPARPKFHLYFQIPETANAKDYKRIKDELQARLPYFDQNAKDAARFFYGNEQAQAWFYKGSQLITEWIAKTPAPEQKKPEKIQPISRPIQTQLTSAQDNEGRIRSALDAIPCSNVTRDEWIKVGMAIHSQGWADGLQTWDAWSSTDPARYKAGECARKWRGFKHGTIDRTYIIHLAQAYGWTAPTRKKEEKRMTEALQTPEQETPETAAEASENVAASYIDELLQDFQTKRYEPVSTGIEAFDKVINAGFIRQTLVTLGASPGFGKTLLTQQIFEHMAEKGKALIEYFNLEMSRSQLLARSLSRITGYSPTHIMRGYQWNREEREKIIKAAMQYKQTTARHMFYEDQHSSNYQAILHRMEEVCKGRQSKELPFIVVIDYLQLMTSEDVHEDGVEVIKKSLKQFKDFATANNAIVFMIMAHSRDQNKKENVNQGAGRDTSAIEYSGDLQLQLTYADIANGKYKDKTAMEHAIDEGTLTADAWNRRALVCTKNRFGPDKTNCTMLFDGEHSRFTFNVPQEEKPRQRMVRL